MNKLKKFWGWIVLAVTAIIGILIVVDKNKTNKTLTKTKDKIDSNKKSIDKLEGKIEKVQEERKVVEKEIVNQEEKIETLKKTEITVPTRTTEEAVANIKNRTKRNKK
jgi:septal ring factor EnvC (AmiA/AmiB activator)